MTRGVLGAIILAILGVSAWFLLGQRTAEEPAASEVSPAHASAEDLPALPLLEAESAEASSLVADSPAPAATPAAVAITASSALRVTVEDEAGTPIADARVATKSEWKKVLTTGADGVATITAAPGSEVDISARHPDYRFNVLHAVMPAAGAPAGEATIVLSKELSACVRIVDPRGRPIEGAHVGFREARSDDLRLGLIATPDELAWWDSKDTFNGILQETRITGSDGRCCVQGITAGKAMLTAQADGYVSVTYHPVDVGPRGGDLGDLKLASARTLAGLVVDAAGPVPAALVEAGFGGRNIGGYTRTTTDADGRFKFTTVPPSNTKVPLRVTHETRGDFFEERIVVTEDPVTIVLQPSLDVTLRLRDATTREPVSGACTIAKLMARTGLLIRWQQPKAMTSENGEVHVGWVPYYTSRLQVEVPGYARATLEIAQLQAAGAAPVELDLVKAGTIAIHAIDGSTGLPAMGAKVSVHYKGPSPIGAVDKGFVSSNTQADAPFDEALGAYILDTSVFLFAPGAEESFALIGPDGKVSEIVPVSSNGVRMCGDVVQVTLQPRQVTSRPK